MVEPLTPEQLWIAAEENNGLQIEYSDEKEALSRRHVLHRWRRQNGGYSNFMIRVRGKFLTIVRTQEKITTPDGQEVEPPSGFEAGLAKLKVNLNG